MTDFRPSQQHTTSDWDGYTERRSVGTHLVPPGGPGDPVTREYLDEALRQNRHATRDFVAGKFVELESLIRDGFPGGDPTTHRRVHEGYIRDADDRAALWKSVKEKIVSGAVYAALVAVAMAVWQWIKSEAQK